MKRTAQLRSETVMNNMRVMSANTALSGSQKDWSRGGWATCPCMNGGRGKLRRLNYTLVAVCLWDKISTAERRGSQRLRYSTSLEVFARQTKRVIAARISEVGNRSPTKFAIASVLTMESLAGLSVCFRQRETWVKYRVVANAEALIGLEIDL